MHAAGFTIIELVLVMVLVTVLLAVALPSYQTLIAANRGAITQGQLISAINFARNEAILTNQVVTICKSDNGRKCGGEWNNGWIIFVDAQASGQIDFGDEILKIYSALPEGSKLTWVGQRSNDYLQMDPSGMTHGQAGTFFYYPNEQNKEKLSRVIVSQTGRVRTD